MYRKVIGLINYRSFKDSILEMMRVSGGGNCQREIIGPNNLFESLNVIRRLSQIEATSFIQVFIFLLLFILVQKQLTQSS
jgi:hypothetical protein